MICLLQAGDPGKPGTSFEGLRVSSQWCRFLFKSEALRTRRNKSRKLMSQLSLTEPERVLPLPPFYSIRPLGGFDGDHPHWEEQSTSFNPLIQTLISSGNTLTDTFRIMFNQYLGTPSPLKLTLKMDHLMGEQHRSWGLEMLSTVSLETYS